MAAEKKSMVAVYWGLAANVMLAILKTRSLLDAVTEAVIQRSFGSERR
jgi:hypothetical protein